MEKNEKSPSAEALFRYIPVSEAITRLNGGEKCPDVISDIASRTFLLPDGGSRTFSDRSLRRWLEAFEKDGFAGLEPKKRVEKSCSRVLTEEQIRFFESEKLKDPAASVPELIRRAESRNLIEPNQTIKRAAVWRSLKRAGIDLTRGATSKKDRDCRRFAYPNRMDMILCDGKHFRAGAGELKRVALFFLDDATRKCLAVVVGTAETATLFLRGLYQVLLRYGKPTSIFVDNGPGFIANDTVAIAGQLGTLLIHGTAGYPEGHGKIERFNRTVLERELRHYRGNPEVDPGCTALESRLSHFIREHYDHTAHEGLKGETPYNRFLSDRKPLNHFEKDSKLRERFIVHHKKRVSKDRTVSFKGEAYELPIGYSGCLIVVMENLLDSELFVDHEGERLRLHRVDPIANASDSRVRKKREEKPVDFTAKSAAQIQYEKRTRPITDGDGGFKTPDSGEL